MGGGWDGLRITLNGGLWKRDIKTFGSAITVLVTLSVMHCATATVCVFYQC
jgi:hypothetical protein